MAVVTGAGPFYLSTSQVSKDGANNFDLFTVTVGSQQSTVTPTIGTSATNVLMKPYTTGVSHTPNSTMQDFGWNLGIAQTDATVQTPCDRQIESGNWTITGALGIQGGVGYPIGGSTTVTAEIYARKASNSTGRFLGAGTAAVSQVALQTVAFSISINPGVVVLAAGETIHLEFHLNCPAATLTNYVLWLQSGTLTVTTLAVVNPGLTLPGNGLRFRFNRAQTSATTPSATVKGTVVKYLTGALTPTGVVVKFPKKFLASLFGGSQVVTTLIAPSRSGSPDTDSWGDAWTDATVGQTGVNHGNENLLVNGSAANTKMAYMEIDLTSYAGQTASGGYHHLDIQVLETGGTLGSTVTVEAAVQATRWFTESGITQANAPAPTFTLATAFGIQANQSGVYVALGMNDASMQTLLGKWVLVRFRCINGGDQVTINSREGITKPQLIFQTGSLGTTIVGGLKNIPAKRFTTGNVVMPAAVIVKIDKKLAGSTNASSGGLIKQPAKRLTATLTPTATLAVLTLKRLTALITPTGFERNVVVKHFLGFFYGPAGSGGVTGPVDYSPNDGLKTIAGVVFDHETNLPVTSASTIRLIRDSDDFMCQSIAVPAGGTFSIPRGSTDPNTYHYTAEYVTSGGVQVHGVSDRGIAPS